MACTIKLNEWCNCEEFQALRLPYSHVIAVFSFCHLKIDLLVDLVYKLQNIYKACELQFLFLIITYDNFNQKDQLLVTYKMKQLNQFQIDRKNIQCVKMKVIIMIIRNYCWYDF